MASRNLFRGYGTWDLQPVTLNQEMLDSASADLRGCLCIFCRSVVKDPDMGSASRALG
jgi:hypothetical protein